MPSRSGSASRLWQIGAVFTKPVFLPTFTRTAARLYEMTVTGVLGDALASSMLVYFTGLIAAIVVGLAIGLLLARVRLLRIALENYIMLLYATPMVALIPFILSMMGFGFSPRPWWCSCSRYSRCSTTPSKARAA